MTVGEAGAKTTQMAELEAPPRTVMQHLPRVQYADPEPGRRLQPEMTVARPLRSKREFELIPTKSSEWVLRVVSLALIVACAMVNSAAFGGRLETATFSAMPYSGSRDREYHVYIPDSYTGDEPVPMVMLLHGCHQTQSNMIQETGFRELADIHNLIIVYPFITSYALLEHRNLNCWGFWFDQHIHEGAGEAEDLYQIARAVESKFNIDPNRRYVTGISSGGAMAVVLAVVQNEYFAAAGAAAGVPYSESPTSVGFVCVNPGWFKPIDAIVQAMAAEQRAADEQRTIPLMVVHSNNDCTVNKRAGERIREAWILRFGANPVPYETKDCTKEGVTCIHQKYGVVGRSTVETVFYEGETGNLIGKGSHYWVGDNDGEYANSKGPSASELFWEFFARHPATAETCPDGNTAPTITLVGDATIELSVGDPFADPGATADDAEEGDITARISLTGSVDTSAVGSYAISYDVSDSQGCQASAVTRTVVVSDCREWVDTNAAHAAGGRASGCYLWYYCAKGSGDYLGFFSDTVTTVISEDPVKEFYQRGSCPVP